MTDGGHAFNIVKYDKILYYINNAHRLRYSIAYRSHYVQGGRDKMTIFDMDAIQLNLEILE